MLDVTPMPLPFDSDLDYIVDGVGNAWDQLRDRSVLITGGTGIIGKWLIATLHHLNIKHALNVRATVVSRDPRRFLIKHPYWAADHRLSWIKGDVCTLDLSSKHHFSYIIHAAADVVDARSPGDIVNTCYIGTSKVLQVARLCGATRLLYLSSGAVYGKSALDLRGIPESFSGAIDCLSLDSAYAEGKRVAELLCAIENDKGGIEIPVARCFAMVGPYLPLDKHFAIGNFIGSALKGIPIVIEGNGTPIRSYLYMADVVIRLWLLLINGKGGVAYNVGGDEPISIEGLARLVASTVGGGVEVLVKNKGIHGVHSNNYYPNTQLIRNELRIDRAIPLQESIGRTADWYQSACSTAN